MMGKEGCVKEVEPCIYFSIKLQRNKWHVSLPRPELIVYADVQDSIKRGQRWAFREKGLYTNFLAGVTLPL